MNAEDGQRTNSVMQRFDVVPSIDNCTTGSRGYTGFTLGPFAWDQTHTFILT